MATVTRTPSEWRHGTAGTGTIPSGNVMMGGSWRARNMFSGVGALSGIGPITGLSIQLITATATQNNGSLYVSTAARNLDSTLPNNATLIGTWNFTATSVGQTVTIPISDFNGTAFMNAIGSATTWYCYWTRVAGSERGIVKYNHHPVFTFTHQPHSVDINVGGSWKSGEPWVNVGGSWKKGKLWVNVGGSWKVGT